MSNSIHGRAGPSRPRFRPAGEVPAGIGDLRPFLRLFLDDGRWLVTGLGLALLGLIAGLGLVGSSGAFLAATALVAVQPGGIGNFNMITPTGWIRLFAVGRTVTRWAERVFTHDATFRLLGGLRVWLWRRLSRLSPRQLGNWHAGELLNRFVRDIDNLDHLYLRLVVPTSAAFAASAGLFWLIVWQTKAGWSMTWCFLAACFLVLLLVLPWLAYRGGRFRAPGLLGLQVELRNGLIDLVDDLEDLGLHRPAWERHRRRLADTDRRRLGLAWQIHARTAGMRSAGIAVIGPMLVALLFLPRPDGVWLVALAAMILGCGEFLPALAGAWYDLAVTAGSARRLSRLADQAPDLPFPDSGPEPAGTDILIEDLSAGFADDVAVINGFSLSVPAGTHLALTGPSGAGKSTLLALLARLMDPRAGTIRLGGIDLRFLPEPVLRSRISLASQDPWIFTASLAENLRLGRERATDEELWAVLELVGLAEAVRSWPDGLATQVAEGGDSLSGGQRKKIGVARTLLRDTPIIMLDEATEGLDEAEARAFVSRIRAACRGKTLIWVSHRSEGLAGFDRIVDIGQSDRP